MYVTRDSKLTARMRKVMWSDTPKLHSSSPLHIYSPPIPTALALSPRPSERAGVELKALQRYLLTHDTTSANLASRDDLEVIMQGYDSDFGDEAETAHIPHYFAVQDPRMFPNAWAWRCGECNIGDHLLSRSEARDCA